MRTLRLVVLTLALFTVVVAPVGATPFGVTYNGGLFTIELNSTSPDLRQFTVLYRADLTEFTGDDGNQDYIYGVGFMPSPANIQSGSVSGGWTFFGNELSAGGCGNGNDSFACASTWNGTSFVPGAALSTVGTATGPVYTWTFVLHYLDPVADFSLDGVSIKAAFSSDDSGATQRGLMSLTTTQVPEPTSMMLLGTGLLGAALLLGRRRK